MYQLGLSGIDDGLGRLTVRRSKTDATPRTVYLTPVAMAHLDAIRPGLTWSSACQWRRSRAASRPRPGRPVWDRLQRALRTRRDGAAHGTGRGAPTHEIMAQGRWKSAGMVADYTRAENADRAAKWLG